MYIYAKSWVLRAIFTRLMRRYRGGLSVHTFNSWGSYFCEWHGMDHWIPQIHMGKSPMRKKSRARHIPKGKVSLISFEPVRCFWVLELFFQLHGLIRKIYYIYDYVNCFQSKSRYTMDPIETRTSYNFRLKWAKMARR